MKSPESMGVQYQLEFDSIYPELAKKYDLILMPFLLEGIALEKEMLLTDYKHPNAKGIKVMANNLRPFILEAIEQLK